MDTHARVISFFSSKGGTGKTVLALNTAILLSTRFHKKVLLVDADFEFGDVAALVDEHECKTIIDMIDDNHYREFHDIVNYVHHYNEGLDILFAPRKPESAEFINEQMVKQILQGVERFYDYVLVDLGINFTDKSLFILDHSDNILFVTTMDFLSLKNTKTGLNLMHSLSYNDEKVRLVVNQVNKRYGISLRDVDEAFSQDIFARIPEDATHMRKAVNMGKPIASYKKGSAVVRHIEKMCKDIMGLG